MNTMVIKENFDDSNYQSQHLCYHYVLKKTKTGIIKRFGLYFENYIIQMNIQELVAYCVLFVYESGK